MSEWLLNSTQSGSFLTHLSPPNVHVCLDLFEIFIIPPCCVCLNFFEKFIVPTCCICLVFFVLSNIDICYFMEESIEPMVLEEHQSEVVENPPLPPFQVHVCFAFFENIIFYPCSIYVLFSFSYLKLVYVTLCRLLVRHQCLKSTKSVTHL